MPSRCIFFLRARSAWSTSLSRTVTSTGCSSPLSASGGGELTFHIGLQDITSCCSLARISDERLLAGRLAADARGNFAAPGLNEKHAPVARIETVETLLKLSGMTNERSDQNRRRAGRSSVRIPSAIFADDVRDPRKFSNLSCADSCEMVPWLVRRYQPWCAPDYLPLRPAPSLTNCGSLGLGHRGLDETVSVIFVPIPGTGQAIRFFERRLRMLGQEHSEKIGLYLIAVTSYPAVFWRLQTRPDRLPAMACGFQDSWTGQRHRLNWNIRNKLAPGACDEDPRRPGEIIRFPEFRRRQSRNLI